MKLLWYSFFIGVISVSYCHNLDYFKTDELNNPFKTYELTVPEGCDSDINSCYAELHIAANFCVEQWKKHCGQYFDECSAEPEMAQLAKTWQESSFHWHKAVGNCLEGKAPPAEAASSSLFLAFLKRKKRSSHSGHGHHANEDNFEPKQCFRRVEEKAGACNAKVEQCAPLAKCWGIGDAPNAENANDVTWFEHIKELRDATTNSKEEYKRKMMECSRQKRDEHLKTMLMDFDMNALSSGFRSFNLSSSTCDPEIWQCLDSLHQRAIMCTQLQQKENQKSEKYDECVARDDIRQARRDWERASGKWHKALDMCMKREDVPEEEAESMFFFVRRKRSTDDDEEARPPHPHRHASHLRGHGPRVFANAAECWRDVNTHRRDCSSKAKECTQYAVCAGMEGIPVPDDRQAWYHHSKLLREKQKQTMETYEKILHECLGTPVPIRAMEQDAEKQMNEGTW